MTQHYLDNSATTCVSEKAAQTALKIMTQTYGNPSSLHSMGIAAENELEHAREVIARSIGADSREIIFTSGGTESNNLALFGAAKAKKRLGNKIVTTSVEHSSVLEAAKELEKSGFEVVYLPVDSCGAVSAESIENAVDGNTILVSVMSVNNETGAIMPIDKIKNIIKRRKSGALFHTDAVQAYGKTPVDVNKIGADLISISSHKIHGPKGAGALYIRNKTSFKPITFGGEQERKIRPGTEPLPAICAFAAAAEEFKIKENYENALALNRYLQERLSKFSDVVINSHPQKALPYILNFSVNGIRSETMLHFLAQNGVYVSSGSACAKGEPSHVLKAMGLKRDLADSAIRISLSKHNTVSDIDALVDGIENGIKNLVKRKN